jgi:hypothetical protein
MPYDIYTELHSLVLGICSIYSMNIKSRQRRASSSAASGAKKEKKNPPPLLKHGLTFSKLLHNQ